MNSVEKAFESELEVFRTEVEAGTQFLHAYLTINSVAAKNPHVLKSLNQMALLWKTIMGALQTSCFIALGRIFDQNSSHNIYSVLRFTSDHPDIFGKEALGQRKKQAVANSDTWLQGYLSRAHEPSAEDFRNLRKEVAKHQKIYQAIYDPLRDRFFAHAELAGTDQELHQLFSQTNVEQLKGAFVFLNQLNKAFWELFNNGFAPWPLPQLRVSYGVEGTITSEVERLLLAIRIPD